MIHLAYPHECIIDALRRIALQRRLAAIIAVGH